MILVNILLAAAALCGLGAFLSVIITFVPHPDLVIIIALSFALAFFDFVREIVRTARARRRH